MRNRCARAVRSLSPLLRFSEEQDHGIKYPFVPDLKMKSFVSAEIRNDAQFRFFDASLLFQFAERGVDRPLAGLEMSFRKIPIAPATIKQ